MLKSQIDVALKLDFSGAHGDCLVCRVSFVRLNGESIRRYDQTDAELRNISTYAQADKTSRGNNDKPYFYGYDDDEVSWTTYQSSINESDAKEAAHTLGKINRKLAALKDSLGSATFGEYVLRVAKVLSVETYVRDGFNYRVSVARDDIERKLREFAE
jgi:hypothetical protein